MSKQAEEGGKELVRERESKLGSAREGEGDGGSEQTSEGGRNFGGREEGTEASQLPLT